MHAISQALAARALGEPVVARNLTVFPLTGGQPSELDYLTLADAIAAGVARVREVSDAGVVSQILFENRSDKPILILDGEELVGAKQNRTVNLTILAPAGKTLTIPVTCIEAGRWASRSAAFAAAGRTHFSRGRAAKMASVSEAMSTSHSRAANQSEVWEAISAKSVRMHVDSPTSALSDVFDSHRTRVEDYVEKIVAAPGQTGAVFAIDGRVEGLEVFDSAETFAKLLPMLVRSFAIDAIETAEQPSKVAMKEEAAGFVGRLAEAKVTEYEALGLGREVRVDTVEMIAAGVVVEDVLVHLAGFRKEARGAHADGTQSSMRSARRRMRGML